MNDNERRVFRALLTELKNVVGDPYPVTRDQKSLIREAEEMVDHRSPVLVVWARYDGAYVSAIDGDNYRIEPSEAVRNRWHASVIPKGETRATHLTTTPVTLQEARQVCCAEASRKRKM